MEHKHGIIGKIINACQKVVNNLLTLTNKTNLFLISSQILQNGNRQNVCVYYIRH